MLLIFEIIDYSKNFRVFLSYYKITASSLQIQIHKYIFRDSSLVVNPFVQVYNY